MYFYSVRDLRTNAESMLEHLASGDEVVLTDNGKPAALMIDIPEGEFDDVVQAVRQAKAMTALDSMRGKAAAAGFMTEEEIEGVISEARTKG